MVFSVPVISQTESIGGGRWGWMGSRRRVKALIRTQRTVLYLQYGTQTGGQDCHHEQLCTPACNPINALQSHEMHPRGLAASLKSCLQKQTWPSMIKYLMFLGSARVQLSRTDKKWISVIVTIRPVLPDLVTNAYCTCT